MTKNAEIKDLRFQMLVGEIEDYAIILLDEEGNIENWNRGAEKIKGYKANEILGKSFHIFYTDAARAARRPESLLAQAAREGKATDEDWRMRKDGTRFWGSILITAIHDEDGDVIGFTKITRDLTTQKLNQEKYRKSEERYHKMVDEVKDYAILLMDTEGNIENWNLGAKNIKGYKAEEIIGKNFRLFYMEEDRKNKLPERLIEQARTTGRAQHEGWRVRKDGSVFWGNITITALHDEYDNVIGFSKVTRDLTDRKRSEAMMRLQARNKELEQFAFVASHDLQEPLHTVNGFIELLRMEYGSALGSGALEYLDLIVQATDRMNSLIADLLAYSRLGRNKEMTPVDCNKILEELKTDLALTVQETGASIVADTLPVIRGYETELRLLFQNLITNAIKFRKPGVKPEISIQVKRQPGVWLFALKDNGIGIEEQYFEKIFMLFQRLHSQEAYEGSGIGLTHCKKIVELHDGKIWLESSLGEGSTFYFTLAN